MTTLTTDQEARLRVFEKEWKTYKVAQDQLEAKLRAQLEAELSQIKLRAAQAGLEAVNAGVPVSHLGRKDRDGMRTLNHRSITDFLAIARNESERYESLLDEASPLNNRYGLGYDADEQFLTVAIDQSADIAEQTNAPWEPGEEWTAKFTVEVVDGKAFFDLYGEPAFDASTGIRNPVNYWLNEYPEHVEEARTWLAKHA